MHTVKLSDFDEWWNVDNIEAAAVEKTEKLSSSRREITILFRTAELLISGVSVRSFWMAFPQRKWEKCSWDENSNERIQRRNVVSKFFEKRSVCGLYVYDEIGFSSEIPPQRIPTSVMEFLVNRSI